jgi:RHS repeat-associated protein
VTDGAHVGSEHGRVAVGHPIDVASGEFFETHVDYELSGAVPLSLGRLYNTRFLQGPALQTLGAERAFLPFGPGWRPTWLSELRPALGGGFIYTRADGAEFSISNGAGAESFARTGRMHSAKHGIEIRRAGERHVRIIGYGVDRNAISILFEQISEGRYRLAALERTAGARIDVLYDEDHRRPRYLVQRREGRGFELAYEGDRVVRASLRLPDRTTEVVAEYAYDALGRLTSVRDARGISSAYAYDDDGHITRDERRGGSVYTVRYDRSGRCTYAAGTDGYQERSLRYDPVGRSTWVTDSHGKTTRYEYNPQGQVIKTTTPSGVVTRAEFDELGRPTRDTGENGELTERVYDDLGRVLLVRTLGQHERRLHHDDEHRLVMYEDAVAGEVVTRVRFGYDVDHNVASVQVNDQPAWDYAYTPFGELATLTAPSGASAYRYYDERGGLQRATSWEGHAWTWTRDVRGRVVTETDPLGHTRRIEYKDERGDSFRLVDPDGRVYERDISADERTILVTLPGGARRATYLSACREPIELVDEEGAVTRLTWGTEPGELLAITNANGFAYTFRYDADMRLVERRTFDQRVLRTEWDRGRIAATYDGLGQRTDYAYDARGLLTKQTSVDGEIAIERDARGAIIAVVSPSATTRYTRDDRGRIVAEEQDGVRLERTLDVMGRPIRHKSPFGAETAFSWSAGGNCEAIRYGDSEVAFERDAVGRETRRHLGTAGVFDQAYDPVGRLVGQAFRPQPQASARGNDRAPGDAFTRQLAYDARGFLSTLEDSLRGPTRLTHNARGDLTGVVRPDGWGEVYRFDACQNRVYFAATQHGAALAAAVDTAARERATHGEVPVDLLAARFPHDEQSQGYAPGDRVVVVSRSDGSKTELAYDANGQVTSKTLKCGPREECWRYGWNARGELVSLRTPNGKVWTYRYDGAGRRIQKQSATGDTWRYVWMGHVLLHVLKNGEVAETYVHEPGGTCPVLRDDGAVHFILPDQNDSPSEEIGPGGELEWTAQKATWGERFSPRGAAGGEPFLGQWYDAESGLHYNHFRYYDPETGRYLSPDPIGLLGGSNEYGATSDPYRSYDRYGLTNEPCGPAAPVPAIPPEENPFATPRDKAFFWSGRTDNIGGAAIAGDIATARGGTTLEQLLTARQINMPEWGDGSNPATVQAWKDASRQYGEGASGTVHAVVGQSLRPNNVWQTAELPALRANPNVDKIVQIDPATRVETTIFQR